MFYRRQRDITSASPATERIRSRVPGRAEDRISSQQLRIGRIERRPLSGGGILSAYIPPFLAEALDWAKLVSKKTNYYDEKLRAFVLDVSFSVPYLGFDEDQIFVVAIEHKSNPDRRAAFQLLKYCVNMSDDLYSNGARFPDGRAPWPLPVLLYNGAKVWRKLPTIQDAAGALRGSPCAEEFERRYVPQFNYCVLDLAAAKVEDLRGGPMVRTFLEVLKRATDGTLVRAMRELRLPWSLSGVRWDDYSLDRCNRFFKRTLNYISYTAKNAGEKIDNDDYRKVVESIEDTKAKGVMNTFIDDFKAEGFKEGHEKGVEQGVEQGLNMSIFGLIRKHLYKRFGEVPQRLWSKIDAIDDYPTLETILSLAWEANSLDEIERFVQRYDAPSRAL